MVVVVMLLVASGVYFGYSQGVNKNDNNHNTSEEIKKNKTNENNDISIDDLNEINKIAFIGDIKGRYRFQNGLVNEFDDSLKKSIIIYYARNNNMLDQKYVEDTIYQNNKELYDYCEPGAGFCFWLSFDDYKKIAKKYGITNDGSELFEKSYNNEYYVFWTGLTIFTIDDGDTELTYKKINDDIVVISNSYDYDRELEKWINYKCTFTFKHNSDKEYYLYSVDTDSKELDSNPKILASMV